MTAGADLFLHQPEVLFRSLLHVMLHYQNSKAEEYIINFNMMHAKEGNHVHVANKYTFKSARFSTHIKLQ